MSQISLYHYSGIPVLIFGVDLSTQGLLPPCFSVDSILAEHTFPSHSFLRKGRWMVIRFWDSMKGKSLCPCFSPLHPTLKTHQNTADTRCVGCFFMPSNAAIFAENNWVSFILIKFRHSMPGFSEDPRGLGLSLTRLPPFLPLLMSVLSQSCFLCFWLTSCKSCFPDPLLVFDNLLEQLIELRKTLPARLLVYYKDTAQEQTDGRDTEAKYGSCRELPALLAPPRVHRHGSSNLSAYFYVISM